MFSLDVPLKEFYTHCREQDHRMAEVVTKLHGARMLRDEDLFACVISSIISQQLNLKFAMELKRRMWALAGQALPVDGVDMYADPSPEAVARLSYEDLRGQQFSWRKAEYVIDFARLVAEGRFDLESIRQMDDEEAIAHISSVRGLGRWTAECVLLFGLGRPDLLPAKDIGLQNAVTRVWGLKERIAEKELRARAEEWKPWRSWYTYYLWLSLTL
jgi:DNA-3-methyladenine glycosylase II